MATNPYFTQLHTQRFSFIGSPQQRDGTFLKDQRFLNMYPELIKSPITDGKKYYLKKRPGVGTFNQFIPTGVSQGMFYWAANNSFYYVVNGRLILNDGTDIGGFTSSNVAVGFCEFRSETVDQLFMCDGTNAWVMSPSNSRVLITDANFPHIHIPTPVFMDGYIFLPIPGTQQIRNSQLQDPTTWPADGFIDAEMYPDNIVCLAKVQNYVAAIGDESIEWFYDNANATGSPLARNAPAVSQIGCPAIYTVNQTEKELILVGQTGAGGKTVWMIDGFQPTEIGTEPIREALDFEGSAINGASAFTIQVAGHKFYVLNLVQASRTLVFDFEEQMWHEWSNSTTQAAFAWRYATDGPSGFPVLFGYNGGNSGFLSPENTADIGIPIKCQVTTSKLDFDTIQRKRFFQLSMVGDAPNGDGDAQMLVEWSDDDYNTWSTPVPLQMNAFYPTIRQMGYSRRRAYRFTFTQPYPLRLESFELNITQEVRR